MNLNPLTAISPIDGRYHKQVTELSSYFSEYALIYYRIMVEVEYFIALCDLPLPQLKDLDKSFYPQLRDIYKNFSEAEAQHIKEIEKQTNHDGLYARTARVAHPLGQGISGICGASGAAV